MATWLQKITNKIFGGFGCKFEEEPKKRDFTRESKIDQLEDKGGNTDRIEKESLQQRRTCHFFVVFPKTEKQDSNSLKMEQKNSLDDKKPHVQPPNKLLCKDLQRNVPEIPTMEQQPQQMQEDEYLQNDGIIAQAVEELVTRKTDILVSQGVYNMDLIQCSNMQMGKESDSIKPRPHHDDDLFPNGEHFDDEELGSLMKSLTHDEKCIFMENLKCDSSGLLSQGGESFQAETTPSPNKSSVIYSMLDENQSGNEQYYETRFSNSTNTAHKRKRNSEFGNEHLVPKIKREVKKEILDPNIDHTDNSYFFLNRQNIASHKSKAEKSTDSKFHHSNSG